MPKSTPPSTSSPSKSRGGARAPRIDLGPSAAHRWYHCRASPGFILDNHDKLPDDTSTYAIEGNVAHDLGALLLQGKKAPKDVDAEMLEHIEGYYKFVHNRIALLEQGKYALHVESKLPLWYYPERNGYVDCAVVAPTSLDITDLKYGEGVSVEAVGNEQLGIYAMAFIKHHKLDKKLHDTAQITLTIYQPRAQDGRFVRKWALTFGELKDFILDIENAAMDILLDPKGQEFKPSDKACRFCKAKGICTAYAMQGFQKLPEQVAPVKFAGLPKAESLTLEQIGTILERKRAIAGWFEAVEAYAFNRMQHGIKVPGVKLVVGKSNRQWRDEAKAEAFLLTLLKRKEVFSEPSLLSPAQAEKLVKKLELDKRTQVRFAKLIVKPEGKPTLVTADDPRDEYGSHVLEAFKPINPVDNDPLL